MADKKNQTVMLFGTFDVLHKGHVYFINEASTHAEQIVIVLARDCNVARLKNKLPLQTEEERLISVQIAFSFAKVVLGDSKDFYQPIRDFKPDLIALGYDQKANEAELKEIFPGIKIIRISAFEPETYKSSKLNYSDN